MINSLHIKNYQSWKDGFFEFHPGVNIIIGTDSDVGKSSIIRALRKLIWNRPLGNAFRSSWGGNTIIRAIVEDNTISRIIKNNEDKYKLNNITFKAFKTEVPTEIQQALNINEINLHQQQDSFFLLKESAGEVANHFNKIANLEKIGIAEFNIKRWISEIISTITHKKDDFKNETEKLAKYDHLEKFEVEVEVLEGLENKLNTAHKNRVQLQNLIVTIEDLQIKIKESEKILKIEPTLSRILELRDRRIKAEEVRSKLKGLIRIIMNAKAEIEEQERLLPAGEVIDKLLKLYNNKKQTEVEQNKLKKLVQNIENGTKTIKIVKQEYNRLHKEFENNFPGICPLCGQEVNK